MVSHGTSCPPPVPNTSTALLEDTGGFGSDNTVCLCQSTWLPSQNVLQRWFGLKKDIVLQLPRSKTLCLFHGDGNKRENKNISCSKDIFQQLTLSPTPQLCSWDRGRDPAHAAVPCCCASRVTGKSSSSECGSTAACRGAGRFGDVSPAAAAGKNLGGEGPAEHWSSSRIRHGPRCCKTTFSGLSSWKQRDAPQQLPSCSQMAPSNTRATSSTIKPEPAPFSPPLHPPVACIQTKLSSPPQNQLRKQTPGTFPFCCLNFAAAWAV